MAVFGQEWLLFIWQLFSLEDIDDGRTFRWYNDFAQNSPTYQAFKAEQRLSRSLPDTQKIFYIRESCNSSSSTRGKLQSNAGTTARLISIAQATTWQSIGLLFRGSRLHTSPADSLFFFFSRLNVALKQSKHDTFNRFQELN